MSDYIYAVQCRKIRCQISRHVCCICNIICRKVRLCMRHHIIPVILVTGDEAKDKNLACMQTLCMYTFIAKFPLYDPSYYQEL